ncbi:Ubiquitin carboxyl-terminal hydrolase [Hirschfeldia incana]|nr:Ubiquitin carboxyl-terminal hydrolase [Hirschfeldia incana]
MRALEESKISIALLLLCFSIFVTFSLQANELTTHSKEEGDVSMVPLMEEKFMVMNETRRKLGSFQICSVCTCCGGVKGACLPLPCCFAINCNIPNRPFGYCSFTPKSCNCFGCHG